MKWFFALLGKDVHNNVQNVFLIFNVETEVKITKTTVLQTKKKLICEVNIYLHVLFPLPRMSQHFFPQFTPDILFSVLTFNSNRKKLICTVILDMQSFLHGGIQPFPFCRW